MRGEGELFNRKLLHNHIKCEVSIQLIDATDGSVVLPTKPKTELWFPYDEVFRGGKLITSFVKGKRIGAG